MKKLLITGILAASFIVPAAASADVQRNQEQTATFTLTQPVVYSDGSHAGEFGDWRHEVTVKVNPCDNTFVGTAKVSPTDTTWGAPALADESLTGSFGPDGTVNFTLTRPDYNGVE